MKNITEFTLKNNFKNNLFAFISSFMVGLVIFSIPSIYNLIKNFRYERLIQAERKLQLSRKETKCKDINSDFTKFSNLGFPKTAIERFNNCMKDK